LQGSRRFYRGRRGRSRPSIADNGRDMAAVSIRFWARILQGLLAEDKERMRMGTWRSTYFVGGQGRRPATWSSRRAVDHARREENEDDDLVLRGVIPKRYPLTRLGQRGALA
jgi:hypothetical protein